MNLRTQEKQANTETSTSERGPRKTKKVREKEAARAEWRQEVRVTAVEAFDLRFLINGDYGPCACVSPDYGGSTKRQWCIQKSSRQTAPYSKESRSAQPRLNASDHTSELFDWTQKFRVQMDLAFRKTLESVNTTPVRKLSPHPNIACGDSTVTHSQPKCYIVTLICQQCGRASSLLGVNTVNTRHRKSYET